MNDGGFLRLLKDYAYKYIFLFDFNLYAWKRTETIPKNNKTTQKRRKTIKKTSDNGTLRSPLHHFRVYLSFMSIKIVILRNTSLLYVVEKIL